MQAAPLRPLKKTCLWKEPHSCVLLSPAALRKCCGIRGWGTAPKPRQAQREVAALWAIGPKAQIESQQGSETMGVTIREA